MTNCSTKFTHQNLLAAGSDRIDFTAHRITDASQNDFFLPPQTKRNHSIFPSVKLLFQEDISKVNVCKAFSVKKAKSAFGFSCQRQSLLITAGSGLQIQILRSSSGL